MLRKPFSQQVTNMWNALPKELVNKLSLNCFKSYINTYWTNIDIKFNPRNYELEPDKRGFKRENQIKMDQRHIMKFLLKVKGITFCKHAS